MPERREKVLAWVWRRTGEGLRVLLLQRAPPAPPDWHPVTGHVEPGEGLAEAARREVREETGLDGAAVAVGYAHAFTGAWRGVPYLYEEHAFGVEAPRGDCRLSHEHRAHRWASPDEALAALAFEEQREALRALLARL